MSTVLLTRTVNGHEIPEPGEYVIDRAHSTVEFIVRHLMVSKVRGRFSEFSGTLHIAEAPEDSSVAVSIDTASIDTRDQGRDEHLRSADFFDAATNPELHFVSTGVEASGDHWLVHGELTISGVTKPVDLDVEFSGAITDPWGGARVGFSGSTEIDREEWGLTWNQALEAGGFLVGKKVQIELEVEAVRQ